MERKRWVDMGFSIIGRWKIELEGFEQFCWILYAVDFE